MLPCAAAVTCAGCSLSPGRTGPMPASPSSRVIHPTRRMVKCPKEGRNKVNYLITFTTLFIVAYANCANEPYCAARTVQGYMRKFGQVRMGGRFIIFLPFNLRSHNVLNNFDAILGLQWWRSDRLLRSRDRPQAGRLQLQKHGTDRLPVQDRRMHPAKGERVQCGTSVKRGLLFFFLFNLLILIHIT